MIKIVWSEMSYNKYNNDLSLSLRCELEDEFDIYEYDEEDLFILENED